MMNRYRRDSGRDNRDHIINGGMMALGLQHNQYLDQQMRMSAYPQVEFNQERVVSNASATRDGYQTQNVHHTLRDHQNNFSMSYIEVKPSVKARHSVKLIPLPKSRVPDMQDSEMAKDIIREHHRT